MDIPNRAQMAKKKRELGNSQFNRARYDEALTRQRKKRKKKEKKKKKKKKNNNKKKIKKATQKH